MWRGPALTYGTATCSVRGLGLSPGMATYQLCDVGYFIEPLRASVSTPIKWV